MNLDRPKIIFFGTPQFAETILEKLVAEKYNIAAVFTRADKKAGRKQVLEKSPVKKLAEKKSIPIYQPADFVRNNVVEKIAKMRPDLIVVAAYGKILPKAILEIPKYGSINVHASLLPKFRGASPIQEAILSGEKETGVTLMLMNEKMDAGEIFKQEKVMIFENDNTETITKKLADQGAKLLIKTLPEWISGNIKAVPQDEKKASYCRIIKKEEGRVDWNNSGKAIFNKWKAYHPWPGIFTFFSYDKRQKRIKLIDIDLLLDSDSGEETGKVVEYEGRIGVQTSRGIIILKKIQEEGKRTVSIEEFVRGKRDFLSSFLNGEIKK
jgi:methionyl-tRNA formyltransferase